MLDNGLADALATLAARSAVPVEMVTDIPERPTAAIETIAYFSTAELLTNVAKHSGARHATLEAVHVPGLLRIRVTDDGHGGAYPIPHGGLRGLAERVRHPPRLSRSRHLGRNMNRYRAVTIQARESNQTPLPPGRPDRHARLGLFTCPR